LSIRRLGLNDEDALRAFVSDFATSGEERIPALFVDPAWAFREVVERFAAWERGERLEEGWVASSTRFFFDGGRILGVYNLRHELTGWLRRCGGHVGYSVRPSARDQGHATELLSDAIEAARRLRIDRLLVTCSESNAASARVIEKCGGTFQNVVACEDNRPTRRYWIDVES